MKYESGNSALIMKYREVLLEAYNLGEQIKRLYGIVPPAVLIDPEHTSSRISLNVH